MTSWVGSISFEQRDNWEICKRESLFGSNTVTALGVRKGDELFIWGSKRGWLARCRVTADARRPLGVEEVPWPDPERYRAFIPIKVVDEPAEPLFMSGGEIEDTVGISTIQLPRFPRVDQRRAEHLAALLASGRRVPGRDDGNRRMRDTGSVGTATDPLLSSLDELKVDRQLGRPAPYQQVVLLWAISKVVHGRERLQPFLEARDELRALLRPFVVGGNDPDPELPWFALRRSPWWQLSPVPQVPMSRGGRDFVRRENPVAGLTREAHSQVQSDEEFRRRAIQRLTDALAGHEALERTLAVLGLAGQSPAATATSDAASLLESLVGRTLGTTTGAENRVLAVQPPTVLVATGRSPEGQPIPIEMIQRGLDLIWRDGTVTVDVPTLGHRSSFVGAVLATLPGVTVSGSPPRLALSGWSGDVPGRPDGEDELEDPAIPPGYDERNKAHRAIVQRRGQKAFRDGLIAAYDGTCAVTGTAAEAVLEAAHIRPYRGQLHNTVTNGLLLRADIHTLFDLHLLTVLPVGSIRVSPEMDGTPYAALDERMVRRPASQAHRPSATALEEHNAACHWLREVSTS